MKTFLMWLALASSAFAEIPILAMLRLDGGSPVSRNSAVVVELPASNPDEGLVALTAAHAVVAEISYDPELGYSHKFFPATTTFEVFIDGAWIPASLRSVSKQSDVALITVRTSKPVDKLKLGKGKVEVLKPMVVSGYSMGMDFKQFLAVAISSEAGDVDVLYAAEDHVVPGQSGGAITDKDGNLVGIISSYSGATPWVINYAPAKELNRFSETWDGKIVAGVASEKKAASAGVAPRISKDRKPKINFKASGMP